MNSTDLVQASRNSSDVSVVRETMEELNDRLSLNELKRKLLLNEFQSYPLSKDKQRFQTVNTSFDDRKRSPKYATINPLHSEFGSS